jgi:hypothetical protein
VHRARAAGVPSPNARPSVRRGFGIGSACEVQMPAFLMVALATRWLQDGSAEAIIGAILNEASATETGCGRARTACVFTTPERPPHLGPFTAQLGQDGVRLTCSKARAGHRYRRIIQRRGKPAQCDQGFSWCREQPRRIGPSAGDPRGCIEIIGCQSTRSLAWRS